MALSCATAFWHIGYGHVLGDQGPRLTVRLTPGPSASRRRSAARFRLAQRPWGAPGAHRGTARVTPPSLRATTATSSPAGLDHPRAPLAPEQRRPRLSPGHRQECLALGPP